MTVEQWAREPTADELARHPAATFGKRAELAGFHVEHRYARGPLTVRRRPAEPDERGKYALVSVVETVDTIGIRAVHPDGRRIAAWWVGRTYGEGWAASPRTNARQLGLRALTQYLTEIEEETVSTPEEKGAQQTEMENEAYLAILDSGLSADARSDDIWVAGYLAGHAAATEKAGDAYGEGYAAGLAALSGHGRVWVAARRRLDALRPGDVILGKGDRWWVVGASFGYAGGRWTVRAVGATAERDSEEVEVSGDAKRLVDVVEPIAVADALDALKAHGITVAPGGAAA